MPNRIVLLLCSSLAVVALIVAYVISDEAPSAQGANDGAMVACGTLVQNHPPGDGEDHPEVECYAGGPSQVAQVTETEAPVIDRAVAVLIPTSGNEGVRGQVQFTREDGGIRVTGTIEGLTPGQHGFHVHQNGDCSAPDGTSAGGHFNPERHPHSGPDSPPRHVGDLGNLVADDQGRASVDRLDSPLRFEGVDSVIGRAVIVHAGADDFTTQPTGNAGARVACGVIGIGAPVQQ
jgi:superoxide dismutase, Cu-Zn family